MKNYLENLIEEKGFDIEDTINVEGASGTNLISLACIVEYILNQTKENQNKVRTVLVKIDFQNGDVKHFFTHIAKSMAI